MAKSSDILFPAFQFNPVMFLFRKTVQFKASDVRLKMSTAPRAIFVEIKEILLGLPSSMLGDVS